MTEQKQDRDGTGNSGTDNLTEVLKLQAEALARMSERMMGQPSGGRGPALGLPPRMDPSRGGGTLPVLAGDPALAEESLPVLNTFRQFLDAERRRARSRLLWVSLGFAVLVSLAIAAIVYLGQARAGELQAGIGLAKDEASRVKSATSSLRRDVASTLRVVQTNFNASLNRELTGRDAVIDRQADKIASLEVDLAALAGQVNELRRHVEESDRRLEESQAELNLHLQATTASSWSEAPRAATNSAAARPGPLTVDERAAGQPAQFRLPMSR